MLPVGQAWRPQGKGGWQYDDKALGLQLLTGPYVLRILRTQLPSLHIAPLMVECLSPRDGPVISRRITC